MNKNEKIVNHQKIAATEEERNIVISLLKHEKIFYYLNP